MGPLLVASFLKAIYLLGESALAGGERVLLSAFAKLVAMLYHALDAVLPWVAQGLWELSPDLDLRMPWSMNSWGFFITYALFLTGGYLCGQANRIALRISEVMRRVEELMWEESIRQQLRSGETPARALQQLNLTISLEGQQPPWYQRPSGLILFGLALPMIVDVLKVLVGLAKLP